MGVTCCRESPYGEPVPNPFEAQFKTDDEAHGGNGSLKTLDADSTDLNTFSDGAVEQSETSQLTQLKMVECVGSADTTSADATPVKDEAAARRDALEAFLQKVPLLEHLATSDRHSLVDALEIESFSKGTNIITEGEVGEKFYILEEGECAVFKILNAGEAPTQVFQYSPGGTFGELALLNDKPRAATVTASSDVICLSLHRQTFRRLIGPLMDSDIDAMFGVTHTEAAVSLEVIFKDPAGAVHKIDFLRRPLGMAYGKRLPLKVEKVKDRGHAFRLGIKTGWVISKVGSEDFLGEENAERKPARWKYKDADALFLKLAEGIPVAKDGKPATRSGLSSVADV